MENYRTKEAPEKIYLYPDDRAGYEYDAEWGDKPWGEDCVEYTRTDTFIDKAMLFIAQNLTTDRLQTKAKFIHQFREYMEGE